MNSSIELHDSVVSAIASSGYWVTVTFTPAYFHKSPGQPGINPGSGWIQDAVLWVRDAVVGGKLPDFPCTITDGELTLGVHVHPNTIPVPLARHDMVTLRVVFYPGGEALIKGKSVRLELLGEPRYVDEFHP